MKTKKSIQLLILAFTLVLFSCSNNKSTGEVNSVVIQQKLVSVDSLEDAWDKAWNAQDLNALKNMLAENAVAFENEWMVVGKDSLIEKFVKPNFSVLKNSTMKTTKVVDGVSEGMVYRVGQYSFVTKDSAKVRLKGPFTLIWKKQADNNWKVEVLQTGTVK